MQIITEKMVAGGSCIGRIDGKAVFVPFSLPGETVDIEIVDDRKDFSFAALRSVIGRSPHRRESPCPLFGRCGGCTLQMADDDYQKELRLSVLNDVFSRARVEPDEGISIEAGEPFAYRSRFQFHRTMSRGIGLKEGAGNEVVPVSRCPVAVDRINRALADGSLADAVSRANSSDRFHVFAYGEDLWHEDGKTDCAVRVRDRVISFDVRGFFQSNVPMLERMVATALDGLSGARFLDFYSGVGTFSAFAADSFGETVLVEHNKEALDRARINLEGARPDTDAGARRAAGNAAATRARSARYAAVRDDKWPRDPMSRLSYDAAVVDPPRQGISKDALSWLVSSGIPELRYVSCDPVTFARDAARLIASGYSFRKATLFDFYPQTHHIETLGCFSR